MNIFKKRQKRRSKQDLKAVVDKAEKNDEEIEFDFEETTDVLDIAFEKARKSSEACREEAKATIKNIKTIRMPEKGGTEKV